MIGPESRLRGAAWDWTVAETMDGRNAGRRRGVADGNRLTFGWRVLGVTVALACGCGAGPTASELIRARRWIELCFPAERSAARVPAPGVRILHASHKTVFNRNVWGQPITLADQRLEHGICVDAPHHLRVTFDRPVERFTARVGIDDNPNTRSGAARGQGSVTFHVLVGGQEVLRTDVLTLENSPVEIDVPVGGAREFELIVGDAGSREHDQAVWGNARVSFVDGTGVFLDELPRGRRAEAQVPFSFVYGGEPSSGLLPTWERAVTEQHLDQSRTRRTVTYRDPDTGLVCLVEATSFEEFAAVDWVLRFRNDGGQDTPVLEGARTLDAVWGIDKAEALAVHRSLGSGAVRTDFQPLSSALGDGDSLTFAPRGGRSSDGELPFYHVQWPGGGVTVAIGWSGQWQAQVARDGGIRIKTGIDLLRTRLRPGEEIRLPRVLMAFWDGNDHQRAWNLYRQVALAHYVPRLDGGIVFPVIAKNTAYDELRNANEENQLEIIEAAAKVGMEAYWLDAYWFEGYFPGGVGNWAIPIENTVRAKDYPRGLAPLSEACRRHGLKFVLWFEPERVAKGTHIDRTYPQWVLPAGEGGTGLFNLGDPEARQWMTDYLCRCIEAYGIDVLRIDFNISPLAHWRAADAPDRQGMTEIRYVMGLYRMWDEILERFPAIFIDNCASGGRRIDLETNMRSIPMWRSDYNDNNVRRGDPIADQGMTMGLSTFMPLSAGPVWRADPYFWRSANVAGPIVYWDLRREDYSVEQCRLAVKEARELRPYFLGDLWHLTANTTDPHVWAAYQYHRPEEDDGFACLFRRGDCPYPMMDMSLRGVGADARYEVRYFYGYELARTDVRSGEQLRGLRVEIPEKRRSLLLRYRRVTDGR